MIGRLLKFLCMLVCLAAVLAFGAGLYIGNLAFERFASAPWDVIFGIENISRDVERIDAGEERFDWQEAETAGRDGVPLRGTYIEDQGGSHHTVILLHGLYHNRAMCLPYVGMYRSLGYNVLLADQRGHGESGGQTEWGVQEADDIGQWVQWLKEKDADMTVGLHGVSLGAAMALLYAGSDAGRDAAFVVADSSYGNIVSLGREKLMAAAKDDRLVWEYDILMPFFQGAMWYHTGKFLSDIEPAYAVRSIRCPVLFFHGQEDRLVPVKTVWSLYENCASAEKYVHVFEGSPHAVGISTNRREYRQLVTEFLLNTQ